MADNDVWIIGAAMTKFGRYRDKDVIDLASEASMAALTDADVTIDDMESWAPGSLMEASSGIGQRLQKQIGQTGIPVFNVANACATGATAMRCVYHGHQGRRGRHGSGRGLRADGQDGPARQRRSARSDRNVLRAVRALRRGDDASRGASAPRSCRASSRRPGMEYAGEHDGVGFEQFAKVAEKNHAHSTLNPLAQYRKAFSLDEVMGAEHDRLPEHAAHVLPDR